MDRNQLVSVHDYRLCHDQIQEIQCCLLFRYSQRILFGIHYNPKEGVSTKHAAGVVNQVWAEALNLGYSDLFVNDQFHELVDDHLFINDIAKIPTIDIINLPTNPSSNGTFGHYWHTHKDNMSIIDKHSLGAVGDVLIQVLYKNAAGIL